MLTRRLRGRTEPMTPERADALRRQCRSAPAGSAPEALRIQNQDLLAALEDLKARQDDLVRADAELEETNRGVLALHAELSEELEQGVDSPERYEDVLVVEDDPAFRQIAHSALQPFTQRITDAGSGREALHILAERRPDLVMLDVNIPEPDGMDVLGRMRSDPGLRDVPVVVVTAAHLSAADLEVLSASAVVLDKSRFSAVLLPHVVADAARLVGRRS